VVGVVYEPAQNGAAFALCDAITDSGEAHWRGAAETRGGAHSRADEARPRDHDRRRGGGRRAATPLFSALGKTPR
jgi:hypothetical protein